VPISPLTHLQGDDPKAVADLAAAFWGDVVQLIRDPDEDAALTADELLDHLHGRTSVNEQAAMLRVLREGMASEPGEPLPSFAAYCLECGNAALLMKVADAGTPPGFNARHGHSQSEWLDELCCVSTATHNRPHNIFATILEQFPSCSVEMLRYALEVSPGHPAIAAPDVAPSASSRFPGNLHYALLHVALNGPVAVDTARQRARQVQQQPRSRALDHVSRTALLCLAVLRERGIPVAPPDEQSADGSMQSVGLDAMPFVVATGYGAEYEVALELLQTYRDYAGISFDVRLRETHWDVGGCIPLDVAIWAGASGPAAALIELQCNLDPQVVCSVFGGDPVRAAQEGRRPETAAAVAEALMRRKLAGAPATVPARTASARRRRADI